MAKLKLFVIAIELSLCTAAFSQSKYCHTLPQTYSSYEQVRRTIISAKFLIQESQYGFQSSWINNLPYHSCDSKTRHLILYTKKGTTHIHKGVPVAMCSASDEQSCKVKYDYR